MPYIQRDKNGKIIKASTRMFPDSEPVPHSHPEVVEFLRIRGQDPRIVETTLDVLAHSDTEMARTAEDLVLVLLKKNIIKMTDMPKETQDRILFRGRQRVRLQDIYDQASARVLS